jgi:hypothetical protein
LLCPYKAGLLLGNQSRPPTDYQMTIDNIAHRYKSLAQAALSRAFPNGASSRSPEVGPSCLVNGPSVILDTSIENGNFEFHFDASKQSAGVDSPGTPLYEPVLFHHGDTVPVPKQLLLAFGGYVLGQAQGRYPRTGIIIYGPQGSLCSISLTPKYPKVKLILATLTAVATKDQQLPLLLNSNCSTCEFQPRCLAEAKAQDNLTLLSRMTEKTGTPDSSFVYLIGLLVQHGDKEHSYSFWADCREEETKVFELFIETLSQFSNGHVFYYGPYEARVFKRIAQRFGPALSGCLHGQSTNILSTLSAII